ncbi:hypothetical protein, partial [Actinoplanes philippinensis]|uniref:hypothetical protein n=1 Tax=Actinoplanes philippinensis TaxID=35752 RepID=UPI0033F24C62
MSYHYEVVISCFLGDDTPEPVLETLRWLCDLDSATGRSDEADDSDDRSGTDSGSSGTGDGRADGDGRAGVQELLSTDGLVL